MLRLTGFFVAGAVRHCASRVAGLRWRAAPRYALAIGLAVGWPLHDALADLMLNPTRIVFDRNVRSAQLDLINNGAETATYRVVIVNRRMNDIGEFTDVDVPGPGELFSEPMLRYSPRQVTLTPGAGQTIRILLRKPPDLPAGEYRSHLLFQRVAEGKDRPAEAAAGEAQGGELSIKLTALVSVSVPVIVRSGETTATAALDALAIKKSESGEPLLALELRRSGNRSLYGDLIVTFEPRGAAPLPVGRINGVAVYVPNDVRRANFTLRPPAGLELARGVLRVVYRERAQDGGKVLAEKTLSLP